MKYGFLIGIWLTAVALASCQSQSQNVGMETAVGSHFPYMLEADESYVMPAQLEEISGITFVQGQTDKLYAIQDEEGLLFVYDLTKKQLVSTISFAKKGDYEEITTDNTYFYVLKSNGHIYSFPVGTAPTKENTIINKGLVPKGEYEAMAFDPSSGCLFVLCKACKKGENAKNVPGYILRVEDNGLLSNGGEFSLSISALATLDKRINKKFKPSGMARNNKNSEWYILSSINQALVITDDAFNPKSIVHLPRKKFEQPEGIVFDETGNLYISSEAGRKKQGMLYKFNRIP